MHTPPTPPTLSEAIAQIRRTADNPRALGTQFETLAAKFLMQLPELDFAEICTYAQWRERHLYHAASGRDKGIDLVATLKNGDHVAIQCKCFADDRNVGVGDVSTFLNDSAQARDAGAFNFRYPLLVTTGGCTDALADQIARLGGRVMALTANAAYAKIPLDYNHAKARHTPRPLQQNAIDAAAQGFATADRGQLIMACGTGKTFVALKIAEHRTARRIIFTAPSIALAGQARREWIRHSKHPIDAMVVCSDSGAGSAGTGENNLDLLHLDSPVERNPQKIAAFLNADLPADHMRVIFSTYQSLDKLSTAHRRHNMQAFDLAIIDEAHRTAGAEKTDQQKRAGFYQHIHSDANIQAAKRLYMTATPKIYTSDSKRTLQDSGHVIASMDDIDIYGNVFYHLKFKRALEQNMLSDYRVIALFIPESAADPRIDQSIQDIRNQTLSKKTQEKGRGYTNDATRIRGAMQAINGELHAEQKADLPPRIRKAIGFCNTREVSHFYAKLLSDPAMNRAVAKDLPEAKTPTPVAAIHMDARHRMTQRQHELSRLELAEEEGEARVICNVGLFGEGIDVPSLDAVIFFEPRDSQVDIVQAVGRVMRNAPGKKYGYIIVPTVIAEPKPGQSPLEALMDNADGFNAIARALGALQSHDESLAEHIARKLVIAELPPRLPLDDADLEHRTQQRLGLLFDQNGRPTAAYQDVLAMVMQKSGLLNQGKRNAAEIVTAVQEAGRTLHKHRHTHPIAAAVGESRESLVIRQKNAPEKPDLKKTQEREIAVCTIGAVILSSAALLHKRIANAGNVVPDLRNFAAFGANPNPRRFLLEEWRQILAKDYQPIFEPAQAVLEALPDTNDVHQVLRRIVGNADNVADTLSEMGYDHAGELYHKILGEKGVSDGAFYTKNTAALLLAKLAIPADWANWQDPAAVDKLRIIDPACGTGTLLLAAANVVKDNIKKAAPSALPAQTHRTLVENVLCGLDINPQAVQIAAANLCITAPAVKFDRINLYAMNHGVDEKGDAAAGSLELMTGDDLAHLTRKYHAVKDVSNHVQTRQTAVEFPIENLDLVIMNPPFSQIVRRAEKLGETSKKKMQNREKTIREEFAARVGKEAADAIEAKAITTFFTQLANAMLNRKHGTLAQILPVTACTSHSVAASRRFIAKHFHIEHIVTSHAPVDYSFSGQTGIHECMIVARRHPTGEKPPTQFVILYKMPESTGDVNAITAAIRSGNMGNWGQMHEWPAQKMMAGDWTPVQWYNGELAHAVADIQTHTHLRTLQPSAQTQASPMATLGANPPDIRTHFTKCDQNDAGAIPILWSKSNDVHTCIATDAMEFGKLKSTSSKDVARYQKGAAHLMLADGYNTRSSTLAAIYSTTLVIGSGWTPFITEDKQHAKALAVWFNSTPGMLQLLNTRSRMLTWPMFTFSDLRALKAPNMDDPARVQALTAAFEAIKNAPICYLSAAADDPTRQKIDEAAALASDIPLEKINRWRRLLSQEPTTHRPDQTKFPTKKPTRKDD